MSLTDNPINLLIQLGIDATSKENINTEIKKLSDNLKQVDVKINIDQKTVDSLNKLANTDFSKLVQATDSASKKFDGLGNEASKASQEVEGSFKDVQNTLNKTFAHLGKDFKDSIGKGITEVEELKRAFKGMEASFKMDYEVVGEKESGEQIRRVKAIEASYKNLEGQIEKVKFNNNSLIDMGDGSTKSLWLPDKDIKVLDTVAKQTQISMQGLQKELNTLRATGKLTENSFNELSTALSKAANPNSISLFNQRLQETIQKDKEIVATKKEEYAIQEKIRKLQNSIVSAQQRDPSGFGKSSDSKQMLETLQKINPASAGAAQSVKGVSDGFDRLKAASVQAGRESLGIMDSFKIAMEKFPIWMASSTIFFGTIRTAKEFMGIIIDIDTKMTDLKKVMSDDTNFEALFARATESAEKFGKSISEAMDSYIEFAKQGYKGEELGFLADSAVIASNVGDITAQKASEYMTASLVQWKKDAKESMGIIDSWNEISNNYATTTERLAQGQARAGATARAMGLDFDQLNAIIGTVTASTKQSGNEVGNFVKAVLPRLVGKPAQDALSSLDISLTDKEGNLRDIIQVYTEVAEKIQGIADSERIAVVEGLAGKFHISRMQALLDDLGSADSMYRSMYESSTNAAGSAEAENEKYMKSLEARMALARVEVEKLALAMGEAFLQEGMIQAIQVFGDMLGILTKLTSSIGALPIILGATGVAVFSLSSRFRTLISAIVMGTTSMNASRAASVGLTTGMKGATVATTTLKTAMRGLLAATGVGLVLVGIGMAAEFLIGKIGDAREKSEELATFNKNLASSYSDNKDTIDQLSASYIELDNKRANGELGLDEQKEYLDVQNQLADLLPDLVLAEDEKGNKILGGSEIVKGHIELLRERLAIEKELKAEEDKKQSEERYDTAKGNYKDAKKEIDGVLDYIDTAVRSVNQQFGSQLDFTKIFSIDPNDLKSYDDALAKLEQLNQKKNEIKANDTNYEENPIYQYYDQASQAIAQYTQKYNDASMQQRSYLQAMKVEVLSQASSVIMANENMTESAKNFAAEFASIATKGSTTASQLDKIQNSMSNLKIDESATKSIKNFESAFSNATQATSDNVDELQKNLATASASMKQTLLDSSGLDGDSQAYKDLSSTLDQVVSSKSAVIEKAYEMANAQGLTFEQAMNNVIALEEETEATSALEDKRYALISATEQLSGASQNLINDTDDLLFMYDELALSTAGQAEEDARLIAVKQQLLGLYPHLFDAGTTALNMTDEQINAVRAEVKATDVLMAAYAAKRDGKLTTEQEATLAQLANTNARIKNINAEIDGLSKLAAAYRNFAGSAIETANEYAKAGLDGEAEEAYIRAQKFSGFARKQEGLAHAELAKNTAERTKLTNILSKATEVANRTTTGGNKAARDAAKAADKASKAKDKNAKASKKQTKAQKEATKAMEESIFVANKYKLALEDIELQIKKQQSAQSKFSSYSDQYRKAFTKEIALQKEKLTLMEKQSIEQQKQIKAGNILKTGVITTTSTSTKTGKLSGFNGSINSRVGYRTDPVTKKKGAYHAGVDIGIANGTRLDAPVSGTVVRNAKVGQYGGLGNAIVIQDAAGLKHIFGHLSKSIVTLGQKVTAGQQIGNTGNTGKSTGPHLHYELRDAKGNVKDPMNYINAAKKGTSITTTNTTKQAAQTQYDIESAKSELTSLQGSILDQKDLIEQLQTELINIDLGAFEKRISNYQVVIDTESEKADLLDKSSRRYQNSLQRQYQFMDYQKQVVEEQIKYLNDMIKNAGLSKKAQDELGDQVKLLTKDLYSLEVQLKNITFEKIATTSRMFAEKLDDVSYNLNRSVAIMNLFEEGSKEYNQELKNQIGYLEQQKKITADQRDSLQKSLLLHDLTIEQQKELNNQIKELTLSYWELEGGIKSNNEALEESQKKMASEAADALIDAYKSYLEQRQEAHLKALDKELDAENKRHEKVMKNYQDELEAYRKIVNEKIKSINKEEDSRLYEKGIDELNKQKLEAQRKMNLLSKDDSFEAKAEAKKLAEEIARIDEELFEKRHRKELDDRIENLNGLVEAKEEQTKNEEELENTRHENVVDKINKEKEYWEKFYQDQLNDERHFAKMREEIMAGNLDNMSKEFKDYIKEMEKTMPDLEDTMDGTMQAVGTSIRKNVIDNLKEALELLAKVQGEKDRPVVPPGTSKPGNTGTDTGIGGGAGSLSGLSPADMKVITGKFFVDKLMNQEDNKYRKEYVKQHGYAAATEGRKEGSVIDSVVRYDELVQKMTPADRAEFGNFLSSYGSSLVSTPELKEYIKKIASGLMNSAAGFDTGGYTGSWGSSGKMAVLHEKELVLNKNQTQDILKTVSIMDRIQNFINPVKMPLAPNVSVPSGGGDTNYNFDFHVDKMTGSEQDVKSFTKMITDDLKRNRGMRK